MNFRQKINQTQSCTSHFTNRSPLTTGTIEILEENHYYPFGMKHLPYNTSIKEPTLPCKHCQPTILATLKTGYKYKYNGKEWQEELGLNFYDYGARNYDPALGRWWSVDPLAGKYPSISPYVYVANNPIKFIDPDGRIVVDWDKKNNEEFKSGISTSSHQAVKYHGISPDEADCEPCKKWAERILGFAQGTIRSGTAAGLIYTQLEMYYDLGSMATKITPEMFEVTINSILNDPKLLLKFAGNMYGQIKEQIQSNPRLQGEIVGSISTMLLEAGYGSIQLMRQLANTSKFAMKAGKEVSLNVQKVLETIDNLKAH